MIKEVSSISHGSSTIQYGLQSTHTRMVCSADLFDLNIDEHALPEERDLIARIPLKNQSVVIMFRWSPYYWYLMEGFDPQIAIERHHWQMVHQSFENQQNEMLRHFGTMLMRDPGKYLLETGYFTLSYLEQTDFNNSEGAIEALHQFFAERNNEYPTMFLVPLYRAFSGSFYMEISPKLEVPPFPIDGL